MKLSESEFLKRLKKIKLVVSDVDGSVLDDQLKIGEQTKEYVKKLQDKNILFTFATQRIHSSVVQYAKELDIDIPIISVNGASIKDVKGNTVFQSYISPAHVKKAVELTHKHFVRIAFCYEDEIIFTEDNSVLKDFMFRIGSEYRLVDDYENYSDKVLEIIMMGNEKSVMKAIQKKLNFPFKLFLNAKYFRTSTHRGIFNLEVRRSNTSKRFGLEKLASHLKLKKNQIAVIGDWYNDREMFRFGGLNIAMNNAVPELKKMAHFIVEKTNNEDGVGELLKMVYEAN